jgi:peptidoglycan/LPS O-acetylase OafA/YrhL
MSASSPPEAAAAPTDLPASHLAKAHLPALDGIRGLAVLMVLAFHFWESLLALPAAAPLVPYLRVVAAGQTGVDLFFVLSGFLITGILLNAKGSPHFLKNFYARRALRILPLYYAVVCGYFITAWIHYGFQSAFSHQWWYFPYLQNVGMTFWPTSVTGPGHFWSLGVEEHFYLLWPMLVLLCAERRLPWILAGIAAGALICRLLLIPLIGEYAIFTFSPCRLDALACGALLAVLVRRPELTRQALAACRWGLLLFGPVLALLYVLTSGKAYYFMQVVKYLFVALGYTALLGTVIGPSRWQWLERIFCLDFLRWCGKYSYAMYVFHPVVFWCIMIQRPKMTLFQTHLNLYLAGEAALLFATVCLVSWASWHLFEKHFLKLKRFFEYSVSE